MRRWALSLLALAITLLTTTFAGMAIFGMGAHAVGMETDHCMSGDHCEQSGTPDTSGVDCVSHCISATTTAITTPASVVISFVLLVVFVFLLRNNEERLSASLYALQRWREGIGKLLLQQQLRVVILRN